MGRPRKAREVTPVPVVISAPSTFLPLHLLDALPAGRQSLLLNTDEWETVHLRQAAEHFGRFLFLKESTRILDPEGFWAAIDATEGPAWLFAHPSCYLAIYDRAPLLEVLNAGVEPTDKEGSIRWEGKIQSELPWPSIWPDVSDATAKRVDIIDGKPELIVGNDLVEKAKGTAVCGRPGDTLDGVCAHYLARFGL